jgi:hypothetical protein
VPLSHPDFSQDFTALPTAGLHNLVRNPDTYGIIGSRRRKMQATVKFRNYSKCAFRWIPTQNISPAFSTVSLKYSAP